MFSLHRGTLAAAVLAAVGTTTLLASPAQAATSATADVWGSAVRFAAGTGQANVLVVTVSGRYVTIDDRTAVRPGPGCGQVTGDPTRVVCDEVHAGGGPDTVHGGDGKDLLSGNTGSDEIHGGAGSDIIAAGTGATAHA